MPSHPTRARLTITSILIGLVIAWPTATFAVSTFDIAKELASPDEARAQELDEFASKATGDDADLWTYYRRIKTIEIPKLTSGRIGKLYNWLAGEGNPFAPKANFFPERNDETLPDPTVAMTGLSLTTRALFAATDFLIERAREEIHNEFLSQLVDLLSKPDDQQTTDWRLYNALPHLKQTLGVENSTTFLGPNIGRVLQEALRADLEALPENIPRILPEQFEKLPDTRVLTSAAVLVRQVSRGTHPATGFENWALKVPQDDALHIEKAVAGGGCDLLEFADHFERNRLLGDSSATPSAGSQRAGVLHHPVPNPTC